MAQWDAAKEGRTRAGKQSETGWCGSSHPGAVDVTGAPRLPSWIAPHMVTAGTCLRAFRGSKKGSHHQPSMFNRT